MEIMSQMAVFAMHASQDQSHLRLSALSTRVNAQQWPAQGIRLEPTSQPAAVVMLDTPAQLLACTRAPSILVRALLFLAPPILMEAMYLSDVHVVQGILDRSQSP